jgi:hypothetical protein
MGKARSMRRNGIPVAGLMALLAAVVLILFVAAAWAQVIENPAKPMAKDAGRVVTPAEVLSISDEGTSDFFFNWPNALKTGPDGSLLLRDRDQVLHFDANGRFLRNLFKKGQGPGEMPWPGTPVATEKNVIIYAGSPSKLVYFDRDGQYERDVAVRAEGRSGPNLLGYQAGRFYFEWYEFPRTSGDPGFVDNPRTILSMSEADGLITTLATFVTRAWAVTVGGSGGAFDITSLIAVPFQSKFLALTHTEDYLIKLFDPAANKVVREFGRPYVRVKGEPLTEAEKKSSIGIGGKYYTRPERKFENDVKNLLVRGGDIWAVTSTKDKAKGVLIDVFDGEGVYRDCFYLRLPESSIRNLYTPGQSALDGDFLWVVERSEEEGTFTIKKYRVGI